MKAAGINFVRMAEFAWQLMEPSPGNYTFAWLDNALATLNQAGIRAVLGTPTASPPAWLVATAPDMQLVDINGAPLRYGSRQNVNHLHPAFLNASDGIVRALATHYADHPGVLGFQVDNEIAGQDDFSPLTLAAWQTYLQSAYPSLSSLNAAWGTVFWSHTYTAWSQIPLPWNTLGGSHNPSLVLDYKRFRNGVAVGFLQRQAALLRQLAPSKAVTSNCMGTYQDVDYRTFGNVLDFVAWDNYPLTFETPLSPPFNHPMLDHAFMRGAKDNTQNILIMEQQAGQTGQATYYGAGVPELLRVFAYQSIANGADGVNFFRWRTSQYGFEQHWTGILDQDSYPNSRYTQISRMGAEVRGLASALNNTGIASRVAILHSPDTRWAFQEQPLTSPGMSVEPQMLLMIEAFRSVGVMVDVIWTTADLSSYDVILAPTLLVVPDALAASLTAFVSGGGRLVLTMRSGVKTATNIYTNLTLPGLFANMTGVRIHDFDVNCALGEALFACDTPGQPSFAISTRNAVICDVLTPTTASTLCTYTGGYFAGRPAVTANAYGSGMVWYVGTGADDVVPYSWLAEQVCTATPSLTCDLTLPEGVEVAYRSPVAGAPPGTRTVGFVLNFRAAATNVTVPSLAGGTDLLTGRVVGADGMVAVAGYDVAVVRAAS